MLEGRLAGLMFSVVPLGTHYLGIPAAVTWRTGSALLAIYIWFVTLRTMNKQRNLRASMDPDFVPGARLGIVIGAVPVSAMMLLSDGGVQFVRVFASFLIGFVFLPALDCTIFVLLLCFVSVRT
jgi:hypothetical protein